MLTPLLRGEVCGGVLADLEKKGSIRISVGMYNLGNVC
jgi:hypothetical protein